MSKLAGLCSDALKEIVDKGVHDGHGLGRHPSVWVNLLQHLKRKLSSTRYVVKSHLVDVDGIGLLPLSLSLLLITFSNCLGSFAGLGCSFTRSLWWHDEAKIFETDESIRAALDNFHFL